MGYLFLLNGLVAILVLLFLLVGFLRHYKKEDIQKIVHWFALLFFVYLALAVFSFYWFFGYSPYDSSDFAFIYAFAILAQTLILFGVFYFLYGQKKFLYWLAFYLVALFSLYISPSYLPLVLLLISFFLTLVLFLNLYSLSFIFKMVSYVGIFYAAVSALFQFLLFFQIGDIFVYGLVSSIIFLVFVYLFLKDILKYPLKAHGPINFEKSSGIVLFMKYFIFMVVLTNLVLVATVSFHEFSHVLVSRYYGCESRTIAYEDGGYPYSEIVCSSLENKLPITLAGPLGPIIVAALLFFVGGRYIKPISFLVIGFNLLAGYRDFQEIGLSMNLILGISILGIVSLFFGVVFLAKSRMQDYKEFVL
ncbi:MAG: hypothetical protein ABH864_00810 [archaeon]